MWEKIATFYLNIQFWSISVGKNCKIAKQIAFWDDANHNFWKKGNY